MFKVLNLYKSRDERVSRLDLSSLRKKDKAEVTILKKEASDAIEAMNREGLCMKRFYGNLLIEGNPVRGKVYETKEGLKLCIEEKIKPCYDGCSLDAKECPLKQGAYFATLLEGSMMAEGDECCESL